MIKNEPEGIYSPNDKDDNYEVVDDTLAVIYLKSIFIPPWADSVIRLGFQSHPKSVKTRNKTHQKRI